MNKGIKAREHTTKFVLKELIPAMYQRESNVLGRENLHDAMFDLKYEALLKEKGKTVPEGIELIKKSVAELKPKRANEKL